MSDTLDLSFVHGRFQPFHLQHLEYVLAAKQRCNFLWIGITRYDPAEIVSTPIAPHREELVANPLTFFERIEVISAALSYAKIKRDGFGFIPLPIEYPNKITNFIRNDIYCFTTICDEWNLHKISILETLGFKVEVLMDRRSQPPNEIITGKHIRSTALAGSDVWEKYIPPGALETLKGIGFVQRLKTLNDTQTHKHATR